MYFPSTILFSQGVLMICHGDEMGRTQQGNNNAYYQDNKLTCYNPKIYTIVNGKISSN